LQVLIENNCMKRIFLLLLFINFYTIASADSTDHVLPKVTLSAYADIYYGYDLGKPANHERPFFLYNHTRSNEVNLNLGFIKASFVSARARANLALMAGTYAQYNLASEPGLLKNIYQANAGFKLSAKRSLWLDAGVLVSHIGFESAVSKDCWTLTRSLMAENTPYYESGARLTYISNNGKWTFAGFYLNGWQRIQRENGNNSPDFGTQVVFQPNSKITLNSSSFIGNTKPDSAKQMRYFHNLYGIFQLTNKLGIIADFDIGAEQKTKGSDLYNFWYSPNLILRYKFTEKIAAAARAEYYQDKSGVIIPTATLHGFQTFGSSLNLDYAPVSNMLVRLEGKMYNSEDKIFLLNDRPSNYNYFIVSSFAVSF